MGALIGMPVSEYPLPDLAAHMQLGLMSARDALERARKENLVARVWEVKPGGCSSKVAVDFAKSQLQMGNYVVFTYLGGRRVLYCPMNKLPLQSADFEVKWVFEL